jgi:secreted trypsin-like serine protease
MRRSVLMAVATVLVVSGCYGGEAQSLSADETSAITNGARALDQYPAVVKIVTYESRYGSRTGSCTGTLVSSLVVLTAGHCVHPKTQGSNAYFRVELGETETAEPLGVQSVDYPKEFDQDMQLVTATDEATRRKQASDAAQKGHDIGVVVLAHPQTITPVPLASFYGTLPSPRPDVHVVGYGATQSDVGGTRRVAAAKIDSLDGLINFGKDGFSVCEGDSGGPVLFAVENTDAIVGVISVGLCGGEASATRVEPFFDFINEHIEKATECTSCMPDEPLE